MTPAHSLVNRVPEVVSCISRFGKAVTIQSQWWDDFETRLSAMGAVPSASAGWLVVVGFRKSGDS